jgi:hypothetical protein
MTWKTIDTAPTTEETILLSNGELVWPGWFNKDSQEWECSVDVFDDRWSPYEPTHWMRFPKPPKVANG